MKTLLAALALCGTAAAAQPLELKLGHVGSPGSLFDFSAHEFAKRVQQKLGGKVVVQLYGSSQLGDDTEMMQKVKLGTLDFTLPSSGRPPVGTACGLFEIPTLGRGREPMKRIERESVWPRLPRLAEKAR